MSELSLSEVQKEWHGTVKAYLIGFIGSVILTALSFLLVMAHLLSGYALIGTLCVLAIIQAAVQIRFFLHVGEEPRPRWETGMFFFMLVLLLIVLIGTLWVMFDLHSRVMPEM
jgi:cytochrome o ubiquinol oxidase subunit IV